MSALIKRFHRSRRKSRGSGSRSDSSHSLVSQDDSLFSENGLVVESPLAAHSGRPSRKNALKSFGGKSSSRLRMGSSGSGGSIGAGALRRGRRRPTRTSPTEDPKSCSVAQTTPSTPDTARSITPDKTYAKQPYQPPQPGATRSPRRRRPRSITVPVENQQPQRGAHRTPSGDTLSDASELSGITAETADRHNQVSQKAEELDKQGNAYFERGEYDQAFLIYQQALQLKRSIMPANQPAGPKDKAAEASLIASVATSINNMTYLKQRSGKASRDESMAAYLKALQMKRDILGPSHLSVGKTLNNIGSVFYLKQEYEPALKAYQDAQVILGERLGKDHLDSGTVVSNIGDVYFAMGNKRLALQSYRQALDIRWTALGKADPKVMRLMQQVASLETGRQPQKREDELSDSENEEYTLEEEQRKKQMQIDVKTLQEELEQDMKFFDLMERQMAIDMVKDKTRIFREMRRLGRDGDDEMLDEESESTAHSAASPGGSTEPGSPVVAAVEARMAEMLTTTTSPTATKPLVQDSDDSLNETVKLPQQQLVSPSPPTVDRLTVIPEVPSSPMMVSPKLPLTPSSSKRMSAADRSAALSNVRDRLSKLRETRGAMSSTSTSTNSSHSSANTSSTERPSGIANMCKAHEERFQQHNSKKRHYMEPTVSSHARVVASPTPSS